MIYKAAGMFALALVLASTPALSQACIGLPMEGSNYIGGGMGHTGLASGASFNSVNLAYARQTNLWFDVEEGDNTQGYLKLGVNTGSYRYEGSEIDAGATGITALFSADYDTKGNLPAEVSVCGTTGLTFTAFSRGNASYLGLPLTLSAGYTLPLGERFELTPFIAPTVSAYTATYEEGAYEVTEWGRDLYMDVGASLRMGRIGASAAYRIGDYEFGEESRLSVSAGMAF